MQCQYDAQTQTIRLLLVLSLFYNPQILCILIFFICIFLLGRKIFLDKIVSSCTLRCTLSPTTTQFVSGPTPLCLKTSTKNVLPHVFPPWQPFQQHALSFLLKTKCHFSFSFRKQKSGLYSSLKYNFPCFYFYVCSRQPEMKNGHLKIKWII